MYAIIVGLAGIAGALLRYWLGLAVQSWWTSAFPAATLLANFIGCLVLGWFVSFTASSNTLPAWVRLGVGTGLIGSFTTFSTFSIETVELLRRGAWGLALAYVLLSFWGGLLMAWSGFQFARIQIEKRAGVETE